MNIKVQNIDFTIDVEEANRIAQKIHNEIDVNGEIREDTIVEVMGEQFCEVFEDWLREVVDWDKIEDDDREAREDAREMLEQENEAIRS